MREAFNSLLDPGGDFSQEEEVNKRFQAGLDCCSGTRPGKRFAYSRDMGKRLAQSDKVS